MERERRDGHEHGHEHGHHRHDHGHPHDRGLGGFLRYASKLPWMWRSEVSAAVVELVAPRRDERVVDLGAGFGPATILAARSGAFVVAIDPSPYMRRAITLRALAHGAPVSVREGAAEALPLGDATADALWSVNAMHHFTDLDRALGEIHRALRPGGRLVLVDEDFDDPAHPWHERLRRGRHRHPFPTIDPADVAARLDRLGWSSARGTLERLAGRPVKLVRGEKG